MLDQALPLLTITCAICVGLVLGLLGSVKLALARRTELANLRMQRVLTLLNLVLVPILFAAGLLVDLWGVRPCIVLGSILLSLSLLALSTRPSFTQSLWLVLIATIGAGALLQGTIVLLPYGILGLTEVAVSLQLGLVLIALGGLLAPPLLDLLLGVAGPRGVVALGLALLAPAILCALPTEALLPKTAPFKEIATPFFDSTVWLAAIVCFCYAPLEAFVGVWTTTYLHSLGQADKQAPWLGTFWGSMLVSRVLFAIAEHLGNVGDSHPGYFLVVPALLCAVTLGNMSGATRAHRALFGLIALGFFMGPIYPMLLSILVRINTVAPVPGTGYAILHASGAVGSLILAPLVGLSLRARTVQTALRIPLIISLVLCAATLMFALMASWGRAQQPSLIP